MTGNLHPTRVAVWMTEAEGMDTNPKSFKGDEMATNPTETRETQADRIEEIRVEHMARTMDAGVVTANRELYAALAASEAVAAALRAPERGTWQPIATAPKDGTRVLTFGPDGIATAYYDPGVKGHTDQFPEGWRGAFEPTHWMPLPEPPVTLKEPS